MLDATDELCQLWSYAEDLETFEYACKELLDYFAGPVSYTSAILVLRSISTLSLTSMHIQTYKTR